MSAASDSEAVQLSDTGSLDEEIHRDRSADRDVSRDDPDSEPTEEANYRETMRGVRSFMNWHKLFCWQNLLTQLLLQRSGYPPHTLHLLV